MFPTFSKDFTNEAQKGGSTDPVQQSFSEAPKEVSSPVRTDVRYVIAIIVFVVSIVASGGLYGANMYLDQQVASIENQLVEQDAVIKTNVIASLVSFSQSIDIFKVIESSRSGYVPVIEEIEKIVVPGVRFSSAKIALTSDQTYQVDVNGVADSLVSYLQQVNAITTVEEDVRFAVDGHSIRRESDGNSRVVFTMKATIPVDAVVTIGESG
ncbi:MAG: hypothetical protein OYG31_01110 [Candidatus Kaiserbacteria bacterium]|nr:hypothetical protein [Candidatus Kaiserbacteria bacterium]